MDYDSLRLVRSVLYTPDGTIKLRRIGKGAFSVAMATVEPDRKTGEHRVFLFANDDTYDKEILANTHDDDSRNPHIPKVEKFGSTHDQTVYEMPLYNAPLRKAHDPKGWKDYAAVKKCHDKARRDLGRKSSEYDINYATVECAREAGVRESVVDALETLMSAAANYSSEYAFEFAPRNLATDAKGNLILLDVLYDKEALLRMRSAKAKAAGRRW